MNDPGTYVEIDGRPAVRFVRSFAQSIDRVWAAVSTSEGLSRWFPAVVEIDRQVGGDVRFSGDPYTEDRTGRVLEYQPPHALTIVWGDDELRFRLESLGGGGCRLTFVDLLNGRDSAARNAAGWDVCLSSLDDHVTGGGGAGRAPDGPSGPGARPWRPVYDAYVAAGLPSGAFVPGGADAAS